VVTGSGQGSKNVDCDLLGCVEVPQGYTVLQLR
jgi:hypothetical protein